jgi:hypothetical protein
MRKTLDDVAAVAGGGSAKPATTVMAAAAPSEAVRRTLPTLIRTSARAGMMFEM